MEVNGGDMITEYLFLGPGREVLCSRGEIRRYVEEHYDDRRVCPRCGCYVIPTGQSQYVLFRVYRCANVICSASLRTFRIRPQRLRRVA
jgi:hypothetical protein